MSFNGNLRRGLGSRKIPPSRPIVLPFFSGVAAHGAVGNFIESGTAGGPFSSEWSGEFGLGSSSGSSIGVNFNLPSVAAAGTVAALNSRASGITGVAGQGRVGSPNIAAGPNRSIAISGAQAVGTVGNFSIPVNKPLPSNAAQGSVGGIIAKPTKNLLGVAATGTAGTLGFGSAPVIYGVGTTSITIGAGVHRVYVECWGGGGEGGSAWGSPQGGGGSSYAADFVNVTPGQVITVQVGVGGADRSELLFSGGADGTASYFLNTSTVYADPGKGGSTDNSVANSNGGKAASCIGSVKFDGGDGLLGGTYPNFEAGSGGGSAGKDGVGVNASSASGGAGDNSNGGAGGAKTIGSGTQNGTNGTSNQEGGGGGGGGTSLDAVGTGGNGGLGAGGGGGNGSDVTTAGNGGVGQIRVTVIS